MQIHHEALLTPLAQGAAGSAHWIITTAPAGPSLASLVSPWGGNGLLTHVLRPAAQALENLQMNGLTHRAIRADNLFVAAGSKSVLLGPCWGAPPAIYQPTVFEPPYSALCAPAARGDGSIADDVYALGVLLLALLTGQLPLAGMEAREIIQLKLEYGSHAALTGQLRLQRGFDDILRAMLSDDPLARPMPTALANLDAIHARRGGQPAVQRAARPIAVGERMAWNRRTLALMCAEQPAEGLNLLRQGAIEYWLRRSAEDVGLAAAIEELRRDEQAAEPRGTRRPGTAQGPLHGASQTGSQVPVKAGRVDDLYLMRLVALLDPLLPLFWRGVWLWPEGLGPLLASAMAQPPLLDPREASELIDALFWRGALSRWRATPPGRPDPGGATLPPRLLRRLDADDDQIVFLRIAYALNPYISCASPQLSGEVAMTPATMLTAVERLAGKPLLDAHMLAFLDARLEEAAATVREPVEAGLEQALRELSILARCQQLAGPGPLKRIASNLLPRLEPLLLDWPGLSRREKRLAQFRALAESGDLDGMMGLFGDARVRQQDDAARQGAVAQAFGIKAALIEHARSQPSQLETARVVARDTASAVGVLCVMADLLYELLT